MANVANNQHLQLTSTGYADIVGVPSGTLRLVSNVNVANVDTSTPVNITIAVEDSAGGGNTRVLVPLESLDASAYRQFGPYVLTATQKLKAKLSASGTVDCVSTFADA